MLVTRMRILMRTTTMIAMSMHSYTLVLLRKHKVARIALQNLLAAVHAVLALNRYLAYRTSCSPSISCTASCMFIFHLYFAGC
ncbi:hypothetical protein PRUPE_2G070900 [Prunus persica]|uniref:Uncharacterized protein n=1 Tax=Prunus persica TaxID=3760 RepID=M5X0V4_PRUPE|nr:hypothetical protein PRUPE_2G070900 [Prunus persica]